MAKMDKLMLDILNIIRKIEAVRDMTEEELAAYAAHKAALARERTRKNNARFAALYANATDTQSLRIGLLEDSGMKVTKLWQSRSTRNICVMLQKESVFDQKTGRVRCKLAMVYPDGRYQEEFGKITLHKDWL